MSTNAWHSASTDVADAAPALARLQVKRWFLRTLVISLGACAFVAVLALLLGQFTETTARILLTLGALALHSGVALACTATLERRLWPRFSTLGLVAFGLNFAVLLAGIWWPGGLGEPVGRALLTTAALLGYYVLATPSADLLERGRFAPLPLAGQLACAAGFVMLLVCIWAPEHENIAFGKATATAAFAAGALAHACLILRIPGSRTFGWLLAATLASAWLVALMATLAVWLKPESELFYRFFGAAGVVAACGTLSLAILAKLRQVGHPGQLQTTPATIALQCPRCTTAQTVSAGSAQCQACGLKLRIEIEEPRCARCGYLLWNLPQRRCPECGTSF